MLSVRKLPVRPISRLLKALSDETRLRIVALLSHGELCVCHLEAALGISQPNASRHLSVLKGAGVVEDRRAGTWVYYRLVSPSNADCRYLLDEVARTVGDKERLRRDVERLLKVRGPGACR